ncbi:MAG: FtsW/RodA/SpoVE family cell cycle protein [Eubacterium sp.]|nr:FtsW/RodA/SpoVE family cell cycle protein [Eubacterium sp.]
MILELKPFKWLALKRYNWKNYDFSLIAVVVMLSLISTFILSRAASSFSITKQVFGLIFGFTVMFIVSIMDYHTLCRFVIFFYAVATLMVAATRFSPIGTDLSTNSFRWLSIGDNYFQPSEVTKIVVILTLAAFFNRYVENEDKNIRSWKVFFLACFITFIPTGFILIQSDLSSSIVIIMILVMMLISSGVGARILGPVAAIVIPLIGGFFWYITTPGEKLFLNEYQVERIVGFLHPEEEALGTMFQQNNSVVSIASGKLYGKMMVDSGEGVRNYNTVSVRDSDFVWTPISEEFGFLGCMVILAMLSFIIIKCFISAKHARDYTGMMIAIGIATMFTIQVFFNIGVATSILPNTGLPLPFLSNGLSSMLSSMIAIGLLINIRIQPARR